MNEGSARENLMTLTSLLGGDESKARELLDHSIAVVFDEDDDVQSKLAGSLIELLERTFENVRANPEDRDVFDHVVSLSGTANGDESLFASVSGDGLTVGPEPAGIVPSRGVEPIHLFLSASYIAAQVAGLVLGKDLGASLPDRLNISFGDMFGADFPFDRTVDLGECYLAGAGAIGNAFLMALTLLRPKGKLFVVDPDKVDAGNLNRCIAFSDDDIDEPKAKVLASKLQTSLPDLAIIPRVSELQQVPEKTATNWLGRLIVAVDSRRVRRHLQNELPGEVFDASTTDIREVILHHNKQPLGHRACMSCIYFSDEAEKTHEHHVAEVLGLTVQEVESNLITPEMAKKIRDRYPDREWDPTGLACDSLFKKLCGEGALKASEDRQVLAPFAFVSVLAGTYLAIEIVRRLAGNDQDIYFNYWRVSPWNAPVVRGKRARKTNPDCEFCGGVAKQIGSAMWT